jgi:pyruvate,water dikinase
VFAVAGGIVAEAGGVLSHCAVVAREYGIPAIVGARGATQHIEDGSLVTLDGGAGFVRIESRVSG